MSSPVVRATILEMTPEARYDGTTYTQTVRVECGDGTQINLFDGTVPVVSSDDIDTERELTIMAHVEEVLENEANRTSIATTEDGGCIFRGVVSGLDFGTESVDEELEYDELVVLDIGIGKILVNLDGYLRTRIEDGTVERGSHVGIRSNQSTLFRMER